MSEDEWWQQEQYEIGTIDSEETHITTVAARQNDTGAWEYAIVRWRYHTAYLVALLRDGTAIKD